MTGTQIGVTLLVLAFAGGLAWYLRNKKSSGGTGGSTGGGLPGKKQK